MKKPKAQAHLYRGEDYVRVFDDTNKQAVLDAHLYGDGANRLEDANAALENTIFVRAGKWRKVDWGYIATLKRR